jgi:potassium-transporting ATPase potassium-binding subunit
MNVIASNGVLLVVTLGLALFVAYWVGLYLARLVTGKPRPFERALSRIEGALFRICGIEPDHSMEWKEYLGALLLLNFAFGLFAYLVLALQASLPLNPRDLPGLSPYLDFNTASSFITNTDLQHYAGDVSLSVFSQLTLMLIQFVAPASVIAVAVAFLRPFVRKGSNLGNFYVDFVRATFTVLLPIALVAALLLMAAGLPQTFASLLTTGSFQGGPQSFVVGPVAGFLAIKQLGQNGGGFYGANSASPFENPNGVSNLIELVLMLLIPLAFIFAYGELAGKGRGRALMAAVIIPWLLLLAYALSTPGGPVGLETRFGGFDSTLFQVTSISTNTGATNALLSGLSVRSVAALFVFMFVQALPGGSGVGLMTLLVYVILTLFMVGLVVGKTPEFLGMKITTRDVKLSIYTFVIHPLAILVPAAVAYGTGQVSSILGSGSGAYGFTQVLYEFTSASANNGSDYLGTVANTPFWNVATAIVMIVGRYAPFIFMMAIAGSFASKDRRDTPEPIRTDGLAFVIILIAVTFVLTALAFLPFLIIGPYS